MPGTFWAIGFNKLSFRWKWAFGILFARMTTRLTWIYLITLGLLTWNVVIKKGDYYEDWQTGGPVWIENNRFDLKEKFQDQKLADLFLGYTTGFKGRLAPEIKKAHQDLGIIHLLSPSGIHWSATLAILFPVLWAIKKRWSRAGVVLRIFLWALPLALPGFYPMKRIAILTLLSKVTRTLKFNIDFFHLFLVAFALDFFLGTYSHSPISFSLSFLFLGILITFCDEALPKLLLALLGGQLLAQFYITGKAIAPLGMILGLALTQAFMILFPVLFVLWFCSLFFLSSITVSNWIMTLWWKLINLADHYAFFCGGIDPSFPLLAALLIFSLTESRLAMLIPLLVLIHSNVLC